MKKGLIISGNLAQDHEFIYPYYRLLEEDVKLDVCLLEGKPIVGILGTALPPNKEQAVKKIEDVKVSDYDILVLPYASKRFNCITKPFWNIISTPKNNMSQSYHIPRLRWGVGGGMRLIFKCEKKHHFFSRPLDL